MANVALLCDVIWFYFGGFQQHTVSREHYEGWRDQENHFQSNFTGVQRHVKSGNAMLKTDFQYGDNDRYFSLVHDVLLDGTSLLPLVGAPLAT